MVANDQFEYDPVKSDINLAKHGIDFETAKKLWHDEHRVELLSSNPGNDEKRYLLLGKLNGKHWTEVHTYRGPKIRIISVRRSRTEEVLLYESHDAVS